MPGGAFDDPDMRYGFAIDKLFSKKRRANRVMQCEECRRKVQHHRISPRAGGRCDTCRAGSKENADSR